MDEWFPGCRVGERRTGVWLLNGYRVSFWGDEMFLGQEWWWLHNIADLLNAVQLYIGDSRMVHFVLRCFMIKQTIMSSVQGFLSHALPLCSQGVCTCWSFYLAAPFPLLLVNTSISFRSQLHHHFLERTKPCHYILENCVPP